MSLKPCEFALLSLCSGKLTLLLQTFGKVYLFTSSNPSWLEDQGRDRGYLR